jgi:hypothetical protein
LYWGNAVNPRSLVNIQAYKPEEKLGLVSTGTGIAQKEL